MSRANYLTKSEVGLIAKVEEAIRLTVESQKKVLSKGRVERTITSRLAKNIETILNKKDITADPFYNRHINDTKRLNNRVIELDIAVHENGTDAHNLLAIELETNNHPKYDDIWKIEGLTDRSGEYAYGLGLYLVFGIEKNAGKIISKNWYKNSVLIEG